MRTISSERRGLRFADWPATDQAAWTAAITAGDVLDGQGPASHWADATRKSNIANYGRWLGFLAHRNMLPPDQRPEARITPASVKEYVHHLQAFVAPRTVVTMLVGLKVTIKAIAPEQDWRWLADACNTLNRSAAPLTNKRSRMRPVQEVYGKALKDLDRLIGLGITGRNNLCAYRDSLMIAFLAARPLRLKNFTNLDIGGTLVRESVGWVIRIPGEEVKNRQPLEHDLPSSLEPYLDMYLNAVRPILMTISRPTGRLWISWGGTNPTRRSIYQCVTKQSKRLLGVAVNPHLFRDFAATSLSLVSPGAARAAAPLLGHKFFATTERHYVRANQLEAGRTVQAALASIKAEMK